MPLSKEEKRAKARAWYQQHKAAVDAKNAQWKRDNRDKVNAAAREWRAANPERARESLRSFRARNKERLAEERKDQYQANIEEERKKAREYAQTPQRKRSLAMWQLKDKYGLTSDQFDAMLIATCGRCDICSNPFAKGKLEPSVDHCHDSMVVRGLLCDRCNNGLGSFYDSPEVLTAAAAYLLKHQKE